MDKGKLTLADLAVSPRSRSRSKSPKSKSKSPKSKSKSKSKSRSRSGSSSGSSSGSRSNPMAKTRRHGDNRNPLDVTIGPGYGNLAKTR